jgi:hypothetical protein
MRIRRIIPVSANLESWSDSSEFTTKAALALLHVSGMMTVATIIPRKRQIRPEHSGQTSKSRSYLQTSECDSARKGYGKIHA